MLSLSAENAAADGDCDSNFCDTRTGSGREKEKNLGKLVLARDAGKRFLINGRAETLAPDSRRVICFDN